MSATTIDRPTVGKPDVRELAPALVEELEAAERALQDAYEWARQISRVIRNGAIEGARLTNALHGQGEIIARQLEDDLDFDFDRLDLALKHAKAFRDLVSLAMPPHAEGGDG